MQDANACMAASDVPEPLPEDVVAPPVPHATSPTRLIAAIGAVISHRRRPGPKIELIDVLSSTGPAARVITRLSGPHGHVVWLGCAAPMG